MKNILFIGVFLFLFSCKSPEQKERERRMTDSITLALTQRVSNNIINSNFNNEQVRKSPIKIIKTELVKKDNTSYQDIVITFKNTTNKEIVGVKLQWYAENIFGEPADMGLQKGYAMGSSTQVIPPKFEGVLWWEILSIDAKKIVGARPEEIVFSDGTKWQYIP